MKNTSKLAKLNKELVVLAIIASLISATFTGCGSNTSAATKSSSTGLVASKTVGGGNKSTHGDKLASETAWSIKEDSWEPGDDDNKNTEALSAEGVRSESDQKNDCPYVEDSWEPDDDSSSAESVTAESKPSTPCSGSEYVDPSMYPGNQMSREEIDSIINQYLNGNVFDGDSFAASFGFSSDDRYKDVATYYNGYRDDDYNNNEGWEVSPYSFEVNVDNYSYLHCGDLGFLQDATYDLDYSINDYEVQVEYDTLVVFVRVMYNIQFMDENNITGEGKCPLDGVPETYYNG